MFLNNYDFALEKVSCYRYYVLIMGGVAFLIVVDYASTVVAVQHTRTAGENRRAEQETF